MGDSQYRKTLEFLDWALAMIDENFKETGKMEFAEVIVYKAAKAHLKESLNKLCGIIDDIEPPSPLMNLNVPSVDKSLK